MSVFSVELQWPLGALKMSGENDIIHHLEFLGHDVSVISSTGKRQLLRHEGVEC